MFEFLKSWYGKIAMTALTSVSAASTVAVNPQNVNLSQTGHELSWWLGLLGGVTLLLVSGLFLGLVLLRGRRLLERERLARLLCYASAFVVISSSVSAVGWAIVQAGLLPWAAAESALLVHVAVPLFLLRCGTGGKRPAPSESIVR